MKTIVGVAVLSIALAACEPAEERSQTTNRDLTAEALASTEATGAAADNALAAAGEARSNAGTIVRSDTPAAVAAAPSGSSVPSFDSNSHCRAVGEVGGGSYVIESGCRKMEAEARAEVARMNVSDRIRRHCTEVAEVSGTGGSYAIYKGCVEMELGAQSEL